MILYRWSEEGRIWRIIGVKNPDSIVFGPIALCPVTSGRWVLLAAPGVRLNGVPALPLHILTDRDEIHANGEVFYFSAESIVEVGACAESDQQVRCGRCKGKMEPGQACVVCPRCRAWHHEQCWFYAPHCSGCGQATAGISWVPEPVN